MANTHSSIHLHHTDAPPRAMTGLGGTVWVDLAGEHGAAQVFPDTAEKAEALASAFLEAARLIRDAPSIADMRAALAGPGAVPQYDSRAVPAYPEGGDDEDEVDYEEPTLRSTVLRRAEEDDDRG